MKKTRKAITFVDKFVVIVENKIKIANISIIITAINIPLLETLPPVWDNAIEAIFMGMSVTVISKANIVSVKSKTIILITRLHLPDDRGSNIILWTI